MSLSTTVKSIQDIMRKDVGVDGDAEGITGDELTDFVNNDLFRNLKNLTATTGRAAVLRAAFEDAYNYMKSGTLLRQVVNKINEVNFNSASDRHLFGDIYCPATSKARAYYTPRAVTQFMVDMVKPSSNSPSKASLHQTPELGQKNRNHLVISRRCRTDMLLKANGSSQMASVCSATKMSVTA